MANKVIDESNITKYSQLLKEYIDSKQNGGGGSGSSDSNIIILEDGQYNPDTHEPTIDGEIGNIYIVPVFEHYNNIDTIYNKEAYSFSDETQINLATSSTYWNIQRDEVRLQLTGSKNTWYEGQFTVNGFDNGLYLINFTKLDGDNRDGWDSSELYLNTNSDKLTSNTNYYIKVLDNSIVLNYKFNIHSSLYTTYIKFDCKLSILRNVVAYTYLQDSWEVLNYYPNNGLTTTTTSFDINLPLDSSKNDLPVQILRVDAPWGNHFLARIRLKFPENPYYYLGTSVDFTYLKIYSTVQGDGTMFEPPEELTEPEQYIEVVTLFNKDENYYYYAGNTESKYKYIKSIDRIEVYYSIKSLNANNVTNGKLMGLWEPQPVNYVDSLMHINNNAPELNNIKLINYDEIDWDTGNILIEGIESGIYLKPRALKKYSQEEIYKFPTENSNGNIYYNRVNDYFVLNTSYNYWTYTKAILHFPIGTWIIKLEHINATDSGNAGDSSVSYSYEYYTFTEGNDTVEFGRHNIRIATQDHFRIEAYKVLDLAAVAYKEGKWLEIGATNDTDNNDVSSPTGTWESGEIASWATYQVNRAIRFITIDINGVNTTSTIKDIEATVPEEFRPNHWINVPCFVQSSPLGTAKVFYDLGKGCIHVSSTNVGTIYGQISWNY